ncbi:type I-E CRISPR-associated protein Cas6/Cse3/CasE [Escherichia coli]
MAYLFPGGKERQFLYRREELQGAFRFFLVFSQERPAEKRQLSPSNAGHLRPMRSTGQQLCFNLRANPTICKAGKRHDLLMEAKRQARGQAKEVMSGCINNRRRWTGWQRRGKEVVLHYWIPRLMPTDNNNCGGKLLATDPVQ